MPVCSEPSTLAPGPQPTFLDDEIAGVEVALGTDPDVVADDARTIERALDDAWSPMNTPSPISNVSG